MHIKSIRKIKNLPDSSELSFSRPHSIQHALDPTLPNHHRVLQHLANGLTFA